MLIGQANDNDVVVNLRALLRRGFTDERIQELTGASLLDILEARASAASDPMSKAASDLGRRRRGEAGDSALPTSAGETAESAAPACS